MEARPSARGGEAVVFPPSTSIAPKDDAALLDAHAGDPALDVWRRQRKQWDEVARSIPDLYGAASTRYYRHCEMALIRRYFGPLRGKKVLKLDLWNEAINTRILHWMGEEGADAYGLDASSVVAGRARDNGGDAARPPCLVQSDIRGIPFRDGSFDCLYTMGTIEHIDEYEDALREVTRVLKPGGVAIIGVPHKWNIFLRPLLVDLLDRFDRYPYSPEKSFGAGELRRVVARAGLRPTARTGILTLPGIMRMADLFLYKRDVKLQRLMPLILWPFEKLETSWRWPGFFGYMLTIVAQKP